MTKKGAHSRPGSIGSLRKENGCGESDSPKRVPPPGAEKTLRPSSASRPDVAGQAHEIGDGVGREHHLVRPGSSSRCARPNPVAGAGGPRAPRHARWRDRRRPRPPTPSGLRLRRERRPRACPSAVHGEAAARRRTRDKSRPGARRSRPGSFPKPGPAEGVAEPGQDVTEPGEARHDGRVDELAGGAALRALRAGRRRPAAGRRQRSPLLDGPGRPGRQRRSCSRSPPPSPRRSSGRRSRSRSGRAVSRLS